MEEVAMSGMNLNNIEASLDRSHSGILPLFDKSLDFLSRQLVRCSKVISKGNGAGRNDIVRPASNILGSKCFVHRAADPGRNCARLSASLDYLLAHAPNSNSFTGLSLHVQAEWQLWCSDCG